MTTFVDHRDAVYSEKVNARGKVQRQYDYFAKKSPHQFGPEAFLVDYGPDRETPAHFHSVDQFQIFFGAAGGRYQRRAIPAVELHYADAFHTYGPFSAGEDRIRFFTLRPCQGQFKGNMPEERHLLPSRGRRGIHVDLEPLMAAAPAAGAVELVDVIARDEDGLAATLLLGGPGAELQPPTSIGTSGTYLCVLAGSVESPGGRSVGPMSLGWTAAGEEQPSLRGGADGAQVLAMSYPFPPTPVASAACGDGDGRLTASPAGGTLDVERPFRKRRRVGDEAEEQEGCMTMTTAPVAEPFSLRIERLASGKSEMLLAQADELEMRIKVYAEGGENTLHAHLDHDHSFVVLDGQATFYDEGGNETVVNRWEGIMLPRGTKYRFCNSGTSNLVLLRAGGGHKPREGWQRAAGKSGPATKPLTPENNRRTGVAIPGEFFGD